MPRRTLSDEQDAYLRSIALGKSISECTDLINEHFGSQFTLSQIRSYKNNHQISSGKKPWEFVDYSKMSIMTDEQHQWIKKNVKGVGNDELTELFNKHFDTSFTVKQIKGYKRNHNISSELTGCFKKGHTPINKGTKGMFNVGGNKTSFKAGGKPLNTDPIGTEKLLSDGYVWMKIKSIPNAMKIINWKQKHRIIWENANGTIPKGYKLMFADGDRNNITLDNLILVSLSESLIMNKQGLVKANPELTKTGALIAKVIDKTNKSKRRKS